MPRLQSNRPAADRTPVRSPAPLARVAAAAKRLAQGIGDNAGHSLAIEVDPIDGLAWLRSQEDRGPAYYWRSRDGALCVAGLLATSRPWPALEETTVLEDDIPVLSRTGARTKAKLEPLRLVAGGFDLESESRPLIAWQAAIELRTIDDRHYLIARPGSEPDLGKLVDPTPITEWPRFTPSVDPTERVRYEHSVQQALLAIRSGTVQKLVLARRREHELAHGTDARQHQLGLDVLAGVAAKQPGTYHFALRTAAPSGAPECWVGASPERLFARHGQTMWTEALAGTRPRGTSPEEEANLLHELLTNAKERHEHDAVRDHLEDCLDSLCEQWQRADEPSVQRLAYVQHLRTVYSGTVREGHRDRQAVDTLHPTPAICGAPSVAARGLVREIEAMDRGLYGGVIGIVGRERTDLAVALRSGRLVGDRLTLYAGAGIVEGSEPAREWAETEAKLRAFDSILG